MPYYMTVVKFKKRGEDGDTGNDFFRLCSLVGGRNIVNKSKGVKMKGNGWRIMRTTEHVDEDKRFPNPNTKIFTIPFKLFDDDDNLYFSGKMSRKLYDAGEAIFRPLDDFGMPGYGCTYMTVKNPVTNVWEHV